MKALDLRGIVPAPVTPFTRDGRIDHQAIKRLGLAWQRERRERSGGAGTCRGRYLPDSAGAGRCYP